MANFYRQFLEAITLPPPINNVYRDIVRSYMKAEVFILIYILQVCNKTAIVLVAVDCFRYKRKFEKLGLHADVGVEQYSLGTSGVNFAGKVNIHSLRRL